MGGWVGTEWRANHWGSLQGLATNAMVPSPPFTSTTCSKRTTGFATLYMPVFCFPLRCEGNDGSLY